MPIANTDQTGDYFKPLALGTPNAIVCTDRNGEIEFWNPAAERLFGYTEDEVLGRKIQIIVPPEFHQAHDASLVRAAREAHADDPQNSLVETEALYRDGSRFPVSLSLSAWEDGGRVRFGFIIRDIRACCSTQAKLSHLEGHDSLTGLRNDISMMDQLEQMVARRQAGALAIIDLDDFAGIKQMHGVSFGRRVLQRAAGALSGCLRANDIVAYWGGDRFCVYLSGQADTSSITKACNRLGASLRAIDRQPGVLTATMGIAVFPDDADSVEDLLDRADHALDQANQGVARLCFFDAQQHGQAQARNRYEMELLGALERDEFELYYQPQFSTADQRLIGAEALLRWRHPDDGLIMPGTFLPILEKSALAGPVGDWVLTAACAQAGRWRSGYGIRDFTMGVNLFGKQLTDNFEATVGAALAQTALPAEALELEITERIILHHEDSDIGPLLRLREAGVGVAFDDYGTGYASLSLLKHYPVSRLKIDRSFVWALEINDKDRALVQAILELGNSFNTRVIAEGVETAEQLELLRQAGCREGQGYLMSRPVPADEFEQRFLKEAVKHSSNQSAVHNINGSGS